MNKGQLQELIQADLDGDLSPTERADLARLLLQDPKARRLQDEFRKTDQLLRDIAAAEPPPDLRAAILAAGPARSVRHGIPGHRQDGWPLYRMAAVILGGLLIVGLSYVLLDADSPRYDLQGSLSATSQPDAAGSSDLQDQLSMKVEGAEISASLRRNGQRLRLELNSSTTISCEVTARVDPATTTFIVNSGDPRLTPSSDRVTVRLAPGSQTVVLDLSGAAPVHLELRSGERLLAEGRLSVSDP